MSSIPLSYDEVLESDPTAFDHGMDDLADRPVTQHAAEGTEPEATDSTPVDEQALASLLSKYVTGPAPGPVRGTFDGEPIQLNDDSLVYMAEAAAAAGRMLTVKGKRRQHYMTFTPPHPGTTLVWVASTPPETPPRGPSPLPVQTAAASPARNDGPVAIAPVHGAAQGGAGIRKRPHKCGFCMSTFSTPARRMAHLQSAHADKLTSSASNSNTTSQT
jgi:hypothetical protein